MYRIFLGLLVLANVRCQLFPTEEDLNYATNKINNLISDKSVAANPTEYPFIGGLVRLTFHDCVGEGNCDGCINHNLAENAGLARYSIPLDAVYDGDDNIKTKMSRADFYVLAGHVALVRGTESVQDKYTFRDTFQVGRLSCDTSPSENEKDAGASFPSGFWDNAKVEQYFLNTFGLNRRLTVALLGAHTLGRCSKDNSGFEGKWVNGAVNGAANSDILNNAFYVAMGGPWVQVPITGGDNVVRKQWQIPMTIPNDIAPVQTNMFLNSDIAIKNNLTTLGEINENDGTVSCSLRGPLNSCDRSTARRFFNLYQNDNAQWLADFSTAFHIMTHDSEDEGLRTPT